MKKITILLTLLFAMFFSVNTVSAFPIIKITILVGGPGEDCPGSSICRVVVGAGLPVSASMTIDDLTGALILKLSAADIQQFQPDKMQYFNQQANTLTWTTFWNAPPEVLNALGINFPVVVPPGIYPYTSDPNNNYTIVVPQLAN